MRPIILEGVLFVAFIAAAATLLYLVVLHFTPLGLRLRQQANRKRLERAAAQRCPIHGPRAAEQYVLLPSGERMCPDCYQEMLNGWQDDAR
jgi:hypothetical protein